MNDPNSKLPRWVNKALNIILYGFLLTALTMLSILILGLFGKFILTIFKSIGMIG